MPSRDAEGELDVLVVRQLDGAAADRAERQAVLAVDLDLVAVGVERGPMDRLWLVRDDVPDEADHRRRPLAREGAAG